MPFLNNALASTGGELAQVAHDSWQLVTRLGEAQVLLPTMLAALIWLLLVPRATATALWWLAGTAVAAMATTFTKVAFIGYEIGDATWDYTGISGHAMFAAAVLPVLAGLLAGHASPRWRTGAVAAGYLLACLIAYSRLQVQAHSAIEAAAGLALGSVASGCALMQNQPLTAPAPRWLAAGLLLWMVSLPFYAPASNTHHWVERLSLAVSERPAPYERWQMHRDHRREIKRRAAAALASTRPLDNRH